MTVLGVGNHDYRCHTDLEKRIGTLWKSMLERCYSGANQYSSYSECSVCDRWLSLSNFLEDIEHIPGYEDWINGGYVLDKDIRGGAKRLYSPETCSFVTQKENLAEMISRCPNLRANQKKAILCIDSEGNETIYDSLCAAEEDGFSRQAICNCCKGKRKSHRKCTFSYLN